MNNRIPVELEELKKRIDQHENRNVSKVTRDILFYDIPANYSVKDTYKLLGNIGKIHKLLIKKQHKHYMVKVKIQLIKEYERKFLDDIWQIEVGQEKRMLIRWFPGSMTLKQRRSSSNSMLLTNFGRKIYFNSFFNLIFCLVIIYYWLIS